MSNYIFESARLGFRKWQEEDKEKFAKMNASKEVMKYFPKCLTRSESDAFIERINTHFENYGYSLWAVEVKATKEFIGHLGFYTANFDAEFTPCVEIGWRLDNRYWNKGYATEGAKRCLEYAFNDLGLSVIYSFTAELNKPSENVMKKIGMKHISNFSHPNLKDDDPLKPHVLYRIYKF